MTKKKIRTILVTASSLLALGIPMILSAAVKASYGDAFAYEQETPIKAAAKSSYGDAFVYDRETPIKYKNAYCEPSLSGEKGLLFYGYDSGAKAEFKSSMSGVFETNLAALAEEGKAAELSEYSLLFTDKETQSSFSIGLSVGKDDTNVYVEVDGNKAGIVYYYSQWSAPTPYGYTGLYNNEGVYTELSSGIVNLQFDPATMQVKASNGSNAYQLVWDFSQEYNDGKQLKHSLPAFEEYTVSVVFNEVKKNGKGELLVYSFGGHDFGTQYVTGKPIVKAPIHAKAVVGEPYVAPKASVSDIIQGKLSSEDVSLTIYNEDGDIINSDNAYTFIPETVGEYFLYYTYGEGENFASAYYCVEAIEKTSIVSTFAYEEAFADEQVIGKYMKLYIPAASVTTTLSQYGFAEDAYVTILKDSVAVEGYSEIAGGFDYTFTEEGEYTIVYSVPSYGEAVKAEKKVIVSDDEVGVLMAEIEEIKTLGDTLAVQPAKIYFNGKEEIAEVSVVYPSGKTLHGTDVTLDELGNYSVEHHWSNGVETQQFTVMALYERIFTPGTGSSVSYQTMTANNTVTGQMITLTNNTQVVYDKIIDLSDNRFDDTLSDRTQNDPLVEFIVQPNQIGKADMTALYVTFTDIYDPDNYISVRIKYMDYNPTITLLRTRATGQNWLAYHYEFVSGDVLIHNATSHEDGGLVSSANFTQTITNREFVQNSMKLYYDDDALSIYAQSWQTVSGDGKKEIPFLLRDYSTTDQFLSGGDKPWRGWTTGEVRMTMYAVGVSGTANVMLMKLDGEDLSNPYVPDDAAPIIAFNDLQDENNVPKAEVNTPYKLFDAQWRDLYSKVVKENVAVYFGDKEVAVEDGAFVPEQTGTYTIVYTASDSYGNTAEKRIRVEAISIAEKPTITLLETFAETAVFGQRVYIPAFIGEGGVGGVTTSVQVTCGGEPIDVEYGSFICSKEGTYTVKLTATDYIGSQSSKILRIRNVTVGERPVFDETSIVLPKTFIEGDTYTFPTYQADYYTAVGSCEKITAKIEVTDANGTQVVEGGKYTPKASEAVTEATIRFIFAKGDKETVVEKTLPIRVVANKVAQYLTQYYVYNNAEINAVKEGVFFTAQEDVEAMQFAFVRPIAENQLFFRLAMDETKAQYRSFNLIFKDSVNASQIVVMKIEKADGEYRATINGEVGRYFSISEKGEMEISYHADTYTFTDIFDRKIGEISTYANGKAFAGFDSGYVYLEIEVNDIYGAASIGMASIANQIMNNNRQDSSNPIITINGYLSGSFAPGTAIIIPTATAYDVLGYVGDVQVTVSLNGKIVKEQTAATAEQTYILGDEYGEYAIEYTVTDTNGRTAILARYVVAHDETKPSLNFKGEIAKTADVGASITLPAYEIMDNGDKANVKVEIYVMSPSGLCGEVNNNKVTFTRAGKYVIYYQVQDENGNVAFYAFDVTVY